MNEVDELLLEHFGTKGMKWGVRRRGRVQRHVRVGQGKGSKLDKARIYTTSNPVDLARTRSFKKAAARKGERFTQRNDRISKGEGKLVRDLIPTVGATRYGDIFPSARSKVLTRDETNNVAKLEKGQEVALAILGIGSALAINYAFKKAVRR